MRQHLRRVSVPQNKFLRSREREKVAAGRMYETLQLEIISVIESLEQLRESPDYELCQLSGQKAGVLDELASERARLLDQESVELEKQAERLSAEIRELNGEAAGRIG